MCYLYNIVHVHPEYASLVLKKSPEYIGIILVAISFFRLLVNIIEFHNTVLSQLAIIVLFV